VDNIPRVEAALEGLVFLLVDENCRIENERTTTMEGSIDTYITEKMRSVTILLIVLRLLSPYNKPDEIFLDTILVWGIEEEILL